MNTKDYENLKVGDSCICKRGHDKGKKCEVVFKEDGTVLLKTLDKPFSQITHTNPKFRLTNWREIDIIKEEAG